MTNLSRETDVAVVGGGPAGMMAGLLFARAGLRTTVLEKHADFLRDFRGDTVHPATLDLFGELGLRDALLREPHDKVYTVGVTIGGRSYRIADFAQLRGPDNFIAMMPQWHFLDFIARIGRRYAGFDLQMSTQVVDLIEDGGRVAGVRLDTGEAIRARLVILAEGRAAPIRKLAGLPLRHLGAPIDVFWFRVPKGPGVGNGTGGFVGAGGMVVVIDRGDYFQCARLIAKGGAAAERAGGIEQFRADVARAAPVLAAGLGAIASWDEVKLLSVSLDRLTRWHRPGLLAIGDAAHAMSAVGGVGINLAIQDAVAAANILAGPLARGEPVDSLLTQVERIRRLPVRIIQALQNAVHRRVLVPGIAGQIGTAPAMLRLLQVMPALQRVPAQLLGRGIRREHIRSPDAGARAG